MTRKHTGVSIEATTPGTAVSRRMAEHGTRPVDLTSADLTYADLRREGPSGADLGAAFLITEATQTHAVAALTDLTDADLADTVWPNGHQNSRGLDLQR